MLASLLPVMATLVMSGIPANTQPPLHDAGAPDLSGAMTYPMRFTGTHSHDRGAILFFIAHDCPLANGYAPEMHRIEKEYAGNGFATYVIYTEPDLTAAQAKKHAAAYGHTGVNLLDRSHKICKGVGATVTPEAAVITLGEHVSYLGRIDDRVIAFGKVRHVPTTHDLRDALDAIVAGQIPPHPAGPAIGCYISTD